MCIGVYRFFFFLGGGGVGKGNFFSIVYAAAIIHRFGSVLQLSYDLFFKYSLQSYFYCWFFKLLELHSIALHIMKMSSADISLMLYESKKMLEVNMF